MHLDTMELVERVSQSMRTASWIWRGYTTDIYLEGSLLFPLSWLSRTAVEFYGMKIHVVAPELQYILKERPSLLNPGCRMRETDKIEKEHL
jgi:hypothetical protein